jgi:myo-inositol-1(or 4)-monophosphatase
MSRVPNSSKRAASDLRHRINAGRVAVQSQIPFFGKLFGNVASDWKKDNTRVTFADFAISERILQALRGDFPKDDFISEEAVPVDEKVALTADYAWVLDPVDGTNNYALGFAACAISLALLQNGQPVYGYIYDHSSRSLFEGGPNHGLLVDGRKIIPPAIVEESSATMVGLHFPMANADLIKLAPIMSRDRVRSLGTTALSTALTANSYLGAMFETRGHLWDIAAGIALLLAANKTVAFQDFSPFPLVDFSYQSNPPRFVAGDPIHVQEMMNLLEGRWVFYRH